MQTPDTAIEMVRETDFSVFCQSIVEIYSENQ